MAKIQNVSRSGCVDMVVSGVPRENGILHASEIASMALDLVGVCRTFRIPHKPNTQLQIRAGIHSGTHRHTLHHRQEVSGSRLISLCGSRSGSGGCGWDQDATVLFVWRHGQHSIQNGVHQPG